MSEEVKRLIQQEAARQVRPLAKRIIELQGHVDRLQAGARTSQLQNASITNTTITVYDEDGQTPRGSIGLQTDGTVGMVAVNGPIPPTPSAPTVTPSQLGLTIDWDGIFTDGQAQPADFDHVAVHLSTTSGFTPDATTLKGTLTRAGGISLTPLAEVVHYAVLVAVSTSGVESDPSEETSGTPEAVVASEILDGIVTTLKLADDAVTNAKIADTAVDANKLADGSVSAAKIIEGAIGTTQLALGAVTTDQLADGTVDASKLASDVSTELSTASSNAAQAITDAATAQDSADDALTAAQAAQATADGAIRTYYQADPPAGLNSTTDLGDLWFDTDTNQAYRWSGTDWVLIEDNTIAEALQAAQDAQTTADGKIVSYFQGTAPTGAATGDLWYDTAHDNRVSWWDGSVWQPVTMGTDAIADDAITTGKLGNAAVGTAQLGDAAVTAAKLADGSVDASNIVAGSITSGLLADGAVDASALADGSVSAAAIAADAVGTAAIQDGAITTGLLAADAVTADIIAAGAVGADQIAANAVIAGKVAANAIGADQLVAGAVTAGKIDADAVTATEISAGAIGTTELAANAVTAGKIAADTITASQIAASAIGATELAANSVIAGKVAAGTIGANELAANSVVAGKIAAGVVDTTALAAQAVTTAKLAALAVTADQIAANTITAGQIAAGAITTEKLAAGAVTADIIQAGTVGADLIIGSSLASPDYSPGEVGWTIRGDGGAEFQDADIRGSLLSEAAGANIFTNGGFESSLSTFPIFSARVASGTNGISSHSGSWMLRLAYTVSNGATGDGTDTGDRILDKTAYTGTSVNFSFWVRTLDDSRVGAYWDSRVALRIRFYNSSGTEIGSPVYKRTGTLFTKSGQGNYPNWTKLNASQPCPSGTAQISVDVVYDSFNGIAFIDDVVVGLSDAYVQIENGTVVIQNVTDAAPASGNAPGLRIGDLNGQHLRIDGNEIMSMVDDVTPGVLFVANECTLAIENDTDATTDSGNRPALILGPLNGNHARFDGNEIVSMNDDSTIGNFYIQQDGGDVTLGTGVFRSTGGGYPGWVSRTDSAGVLMYQNDFYISGSDLSGSNRDLYCNSAHQTSDMRFKSSDGAPSIAGIDVVRGAPSTVWRFNRSGDTKWRMGAMAQDLPEEFQHTSSIDNHSKISVDIGTMIGVLWGAVRAIDAELDEWRKDKKKPLPSRKQAPG